MMKRVPSSIGITAMAFLSLASPVQASELQCALDFLGSLGVHAPPGYTVTTGNGKYIAETNRTAKTITISPSAMETILPNLAALNGDELSYSGVLAVILFHEFRHADGSFIADPRTNNGKCQEADLQRQTAVDHCELVGDICNEIPGADVSPLCAFYDDVQDSFNSGIGPAAHQIGCMGTAEDFVPMPDCESCGDDNMCPE